MSRSNYTASERRGILAIALVSLLFIGVGIGVSFWGGNEDESYPEPVVVNHPEMVDTVELRNQKAKSSIKDKAKSKSSTGNKKRPKTYRRRSPHDEPV